MSLFEDAGRRPEFHGWLEPDDDCPVSGQYPLRLITGARVPGYYHSQQRTDPVLKRTAPAPAADISPELAEKLGVRDGTIITVVTATGRMELPARIRPGQESATVSIPHGWPGLENVNYLVAADELEPLAATPAYRARPCRVEVPEPLV
jgi:assimilatory nitrate reductase catalytic subunit